MDASAKALRARALRIVSRAGSSNPGLDFIALAIQGKGNGFRKVIAMIDEMNKMLTGDQVDDNTKKEECLKQIKASDDEIKGLESSSSDLQTVIDEVQMSLDGVTAEIRALEKEIRELDKSTADATKVRKEEHSDYTNVMASDSAAKELINFAKNRMNQFYNPNLYKAAKNEELSAQQRIYENHADLLQESNDPGRHESSNGVIAMMDLLIAELDKEMQEATTDEANGKEIFERMLKDAEEKRADDLALLAERQSAKATLEGNLQAHSDGGRTLEKKLVASKEHSSALHSDCDWLLQNYDARKEARANEKDALTAAKAVLSGADYES
eukprot:NODE_6477_length_1668_cov_5.528877.p1 GENE.NODE_6477_length_1668_cov_5.528877~~NODE_6477_length_1668_cov_5.528877.p1  ORF type:complete len:327 (-),score=124.45 NODE_6477_length_1668_cov_5.528877:224-1204(-)